MVRDPFFSAYENLITFFCKNSQKMVPHGQDRVALVHTVKKKMTTFPSCALHYQHNISSSCSAFDRKSFHKFPISKKKKKNQREAWNRIDV